MTTGEAIEQLKWYFKCDDGIASESVTKEAILRAIEALLKIEVIQEVIDMPMLWEQDDRRRYAKIVDIVRNDLAQEVEAEMKGKENENDKE